jgi:hypothetical protein
VLSPLDKVGTQVYKESEGAFIVLTGKLMGSEFCLDVLNPLAT